jgi:hypothetical protein
MRIMIQSRVQFLSQHPPTQFKLPQGGILAVKHQKMLMSAELYQIILQHPFHHLQHGEAKNGYTIDRASGLTLSITTNLLACFSRLGSIEFYSFHNTGGRPTQNSHSKVDTNTHVWPAF